MATLSRELRGRLERTVRDARDTAEAGARKALEQLAVHHHEPWATMSPEGRTLRNRLRARGRQLGDQADERRGVQPIAKLTAECAYEQWHRMLFARFLAESGVLVEPTSGVAISLDECKELAREQSTDWLAVASSFAQRMLPQIFRSDDPVLEVPLPIEYRHALEELLGSLPTEVFLSDDSLGWVYQFWQSKRKDEINASGVKIGADEVPAVTQLFTEDYMVLFLLENTLGAWWAGKIFQRHPELAQSASDEDDLRGACSPPGYRWTYLRFIKSDHGQWTPAAGCYDGWPCEAKDIRVLDPCMGSGHFLVFALAILSAIRIAEEGLAEADAINSVLRDNLFGLEIDPRCTQIAAFNLALAAWRRIGFGMLPSLNLACSGLAINAKEGEWLALAGDSDAGRKGMQALYRLFQSAPTIGSLIDPRTAAGDLYAAGFNELRPLLESALARESVDVGYHEMAVAAHGMARAAGLLRAQFTLITTNVPYLGRGRQQQGLKDYCGGHHALAKADLATCVLQRCLTFCAPRGTVALVTPQHWMFLRTYMPLRRELLRRCEWSMVGKLGPRAFETISGEVVNVALLALSTRPASQDQTFFGLDAYDCDTAQRKAVRLRKAPVYVLNQHQQRQNPDSTIVLSQRHAHPLLSTTVDSIQGTTTGDNPRYVAKFWELPSVTAGWELFQGTVEASIPYGGRDGILYWEGGAGELASSPEARIQGQAAFGREGVFVAQMSSLPATLYSGQFFNMNGAALVPRSTQDLAAVWCFCSSGDFAKEVRQIDQKLNVTNASLVKVPFDSERWHHIAEEEYPNGLPKPESTDCSQWLFSGHPSRSEHALQVTIARLLGYSWPRHTGSTLLDCEALGHDGLERHSDDDGIVCLNPLHGEATAADRLTRLLADAFGDEWSSAKLNELLTDIGYGGRSLEAWLREGFFEQHCELFHQRPFVWHVWDGLKDGFAALMNYHRLAGPNAEGRRTLEKLIYTYLGDWLDRQRADQTAGIQGADARLAAAQHLKRELEKILEGEPPYDIFVRWKPVHEQPIGWEPDLNDGVRINIRPFMTAKPLGARARNACILRTTPKIKWDKDRGKEPNRPIEDFPWFWGWDEQTVDFAGRGKEPDGNRWNNLHYTRDFKLAARERTQAKGGQ